MNKSAMMREMYMQGMLPAEVSKELNCNYAYCYGVYQRWCEANGNDYHISAEGEKKSDVIREMFTAGKTAGEISKELNTNYTYVWNVINRYRKEQEA